MATIKVVPLVDIEYKGKKRSANSEAFDMDEETARALINDRIIKEVADEPAKTTKPRPTQVQE